MGFFFHHLRGETKKVIIRLPLGSFRRFQLKSMNYSGLLSAVADYLETHGIKQDVISFLDEALKGNSWKTKVAIDISLQIENGFKRNGITENDVDSVKIINTDAYNSPEEFFKDEGLIK